MSTKPLDWDVTGQKITSVHRITTYQKSVHQRYSSKQLYAKNSYKTEIYSQAHGHFRSTERLRILKIPCTHIHKLHGKTYNSFDSSSHLEGIVGQGSFPPHKRNNLNT